VVFCATPAYFFDESGFLRDTESEPSAGLLLSFLEFRIALMTLDFDVALCIEQNNEPGLDSWLAQGNRLDAPLKERPISALHLMARNPFWAPWLGVNGPRLAGAGMDPDARAVGAALSPLSEACAANRLETAKSFLAMGADIDGAGAPQGGPLHFCPDDLEFLEFLLNSGAQINHVNHFGKTPLRQWVDNKHRKSFAARALAAGADAGIRCNLGESPLRVAMEMDLEDWVRQMMNYGSHFEDLACIDPQTGELSADAVADGLPASLGQMLERLASGGTDCRNRVILLLKLAGPDEARLALGPSSRGGITPALEIAARKGHFQMAAKFIKDGAQWSGPAGPKATEPRPFSDMGVLGICLWHCAQSNEPLTRTPHGQLAIFVAKKCAARPELWSQLQSMAALLSSLEDPTWIRAREHFGHLQAVMEQEAMRLSMPTAVLRRDEPTPRRPSRRL